MLDSLEGMQVTRCAMIKTTWWAEKAGTRVFSYYDGNFQVTWKWNALMKREVVILCVNNIVHG